MGLEIKQSLRVSQQLVMTPQLQQAIKLLQLNRTELAEVVNQEMMENPILEELSETPEGELQAQTDNTTPESADPETAQTRDEEGFLKPTPKEEQLTQGKDDFNWDSYIEDFNSSSSSAPSMREINDELPSFENVLTKTTSLEDHLMWQLSMTPLQAEEQKLGYLLIGHLCDHSDV